MLLLPTVATTLIRSESLPVEKEQHRPTSHSEKRSATIRSASTVFSALATGSSSSSNRIERDVTHCHAVRQLAANYLAFVQLASIRLSAARFMSRVLVDLPKVTRITQVNIAGWFRLRWA